MADSSGKASFGKVRRDATSNCNRGSRNRSEFGSSRCANRQEERVNMDRPFRDRDPDRPAKSRSISDKLATRGSCSRGMAERPRVAKGDRANSRGMMMETTHLTTGIGDRVNSRGIVEPAYVSRAMGDRTNSKSAIEKKGLGEKNMVNAMTKPNSISGTIVQMNANSSSTKSLDSETGVTWRFAETSAEKLYLAATDKGDKKAVLHSLENANPARFNINCIDGEGRTALVIAIQNGNIDIVKLLLDHDIELGDALLRAVDVQLTSAVLLICENIKKRNIPARLYCRALNGDLHPDITPIILAAHHNNYDIVKILLDHGARIEDPEFYSFQTEEFTLQHSLGTINVYKALASQAYISLTSEDPIGTAFELSHKLRALSSRDYEFRYQYGELAAQCELFAADLLGHVRDSEEQGTILNHDPEEWARADDMYDLEPYKVKVAIRFKQKKFVAHPHCQQRLIAIWYHGLRGWRDLSRSTACCFTLLIGACFPVLSLCYILAPTGRFARFLRIPYVKFICHTASSLFFLVLLGLQAVDLNLFPDDDKNDDVVDERTIHDTRNEMPGFTEWLILIWVIGYTWAECREVWNKGTRYLDENIRWKLFEYVTLALYWSWIALRVTVLLRPSESTMADIYINTTTVGSLETFSDDSDYINIDSSGDERNFSTPLPDTTSGTVVDEIQQLNVRLESILQYQQQLSDNITESFHSAIGQLSSALQNIKTAIDDSSAARTYYPSSRSRGQSSSCGSQVVSTDSARNKWDAFDPVLVSEGLFAIAKVFSFLRVIRITVVSLHVGPMQISLGRMMFDIVKFMMIFCLVWFAFSVGLNQLYWYYSREIKLWCKKNNVLNCKQPFGTIPDTLNTLFWALFGVSELASLDIMDANHWFTETVGGLLYAAYHVIALVVLLNVLIAMMSNTFTHVEEDADMQWKYSRSKLWMSYFEEGATLPPPFNFLPTWKSTWRLFLHIKRKCMKENDVRKERKETVLHKKDAEYKEVVQQLVRRYIFDKRRGSDDDDATAGPDPWILQLKQDMSGLKYDMFDALGQMENKMQNVEDKVETIQQTVTEQPLQLPPRRPSSQDNLECPPYPDSNNSTMADIHSHTLSQSTPSLDMDTDFASYLGLPDDQRPLLPLKRWGYIRYIDDISMRSRLSSTGSHLSYTLAPSLDRHYNPVT
ncbi:short transient receptor potential channel 4-like [Ptychodera flava]|uniref:short transient receptor potential channel 4-like n=1 Tax=Ptychodera flava TaxID=63121 RepID=UPI003969BC98